MPTAIHPFSQEEMMAYLDGELPAGHALAAAQHLEECRDCQRLAADFQSVSRGLLDWRIEPTTSSPPQAEVALAKQANRRLAKRPWFVIASVSAALVITALVELTVSPHGTAVKSLAVPSDVGHEQRIRPNLKHFYGRESGGVAGVISPELASRGLAPPPPTADGSLPGPLVVRTAVLALTSKSFEQSRGEVERIARVNQGYLSQLELTTPNGAARTLSATLRVPAGRLDTVLDALRRLGHVDGESQRGDDVTQRYVDINARLANLRTTEQRLLQILRERTGRLADVLQVEEAVDRTRGEIELTEAEQKALAGQIELAAVSLRISEEYKAGFETGESSAWTRVRNAAVEGYRNVANGAMAVLEFLLSIGPSLLLVAAIAFFPLRWWRRRQRR